MTPLAETQLVYISPAEGRSGVGDYATDFVNAVAGNFRGVTEYRIETDGAETVRDVARNVRGIRRVVRREMQRGPVIVHIEQSAGSLSTFWAALALRSVPVTGTIHDAPQPVWWPFKTKLLCRSRLLHHGIHFPLRPVTMALQRRATKGQSLVTLTSIGAEQTQRTMSEADVAASRIFVPERAPLPPLIERPIAVGLFGHVYKGKGFDLIGDLREKLDDDVDIVVAGRGTQDLPPTEGVTILGEVNGSDEDAFFASIRFLAVPYSKDNRYGKVWAASSAVSRSYAYGTPIVCVLDGSLSETATEGGAIGVDGGIHGIADAVNKFVRDEATLERLGDEVATLQREHSLEQCVVPFVNIWRELSGD